MSVFAFFILIILIVAGVLMYRSARRDKKLNDAIQRNRDIRNEVKISEIDADSDHLLKTLTTTEKTTDE
jgi:uncharacterized membrane protein